MKLKNRKILVITIFFYLFLLQAIFVIGGFRSSLSDNEHTIRKHKTSYLKGHNIPITDLEKFGANLDNYTKEILELTEAKIKNENLPEIDIFSIQMTFTKELEILIAVRGDLEESIHFENTTLLFFSEDTVSGEPYNMEYNFSKGLWHYHYANYSINQKSSKDSKLKYNEEKNSQPNWTKISLTGFKSKYFSPYFNIKNARFVMLTYFKKYVYIETIPQPLGNIMPYLITGLVIFTIIFMASMIFLIRKKIIFKKNKRVRNLFQKKYTLSRKSSKSRKKSVKKKKKR